MTSETYLHLTSVLEPKGALMQIARNGREALDAPAGGRRKQHGRIDLVLMDVMMPEDGRLYGHARDPPATGAEEAPDHCADCQGDAG